MMGAVESFRIYLMQASDEKLQELKTIRVLGPNMFQANVFTLRLREMVHHEENDRYFNSFRKTA